VCIFVCKVGGWFVAFRLVQMGFKVVHNSVWIDHDLWLRYCYIFLLVTFPDNYQSVTGGFYFLLLLSGFLEAVSSIGLLAVGRTTMPVASVILKHCFGCWFITTHQRSSYCWLAPMPTVSMMNM